MAALIALAFAGCGDPPLADPCIDTPTYTNQIKPMILDTKCLQCHSMMLKMQARQGAPEGIDFDTYELAQPHFDAMSSAITSGREPPPTLMPKIEVTPAERELVSDWRSCMYPK